MIALKPGDVFLTRSSSRLGKLIRVFTRRIGESRTKVNHVGIIVSHGPIQNIICVEALEKVERHLLWEKYINRGDDVAIFRPMNVTGEALKKVVEKAESYVGKKYGYAKLVTHFLDWALQGAYVFRRLTNSDKYPICSWLVAKSFASQGLNFGVAPGAATPDDIWDFVNKNVDKYMVIRVLKPLKIESPLKIEP